MLCTECNGNGYTYDNPEGMELQSSGIGHKTFRCWKCNGTGETKSDIVIDKEILISELVNDRMHYIGLNTDQRHWCLAEKQMYDELYIHFSSLIEDIFE